METLGFLHPRKMDYICIIRCRSHFIGFYELSKFMFLMTDSFLFPFSLPRKNVCPLCRWLGNIRNKMYHSRIRNERLLRRLDVIHKEFNFGEANDLHCDLCVLVF